MEVDLSSQTSQVPVTYRADLMRGCEAVRQIFTKFAGIRNQIFCIYYLFYITLLATSDELIIPCVFTSQFLIS